MGTAGVYTWAQKPYPPPPSEDDIFSSSHHMLKFPLHAPFLALFLLLLHLFYLLTSMSPFLLSFLLFPSHFPVFFSFHLFVFLPGGGVLFSNIYTLVYCMSRVDNCLSLVLKEWIVLGCVARNVSMSPLFLSLWFFALRSFATKWCLIN